MLDTLVLADRPAEDLALVRVSCRAPKGCAAEADRFRGDEDALRVEPVQNVAEALAFLPDPVFHRDAKPVDEHLVGIHALAAQLLDLADFDLRAVQVRVEETESFRTLAFLGVLRPGQQEALVCDLCRAGPDL